MKGYVKALIGVGAATVAGLGALAFIGKSPKVEDFDADFDYEDDVTDQEDTTTEDKKETED